MNRYVVDEVSRKRYDLFAICPKCRGEIYWRSYNTIVSQDNDEPIREEIVAHCENSSLAYRSIQSMYSRKLCEWRGKVSRSDDGDLVIMNFDNTPVPYRIFISDISSYDVDYMLDFVV